VLVEVVATIETLLVYKLLLLEELDKLTQVVAVMQTYLAKRVS
jgi:hypothetical protein